MPVIRFWRERILIPRPAAHAWFYMTFKNKPEIQNRLLVNLWYATAKTEEEKQSIKENQNLSDEDIALFKSMKFLPYSEPKTEKEKEVSATPITNFDEVEAEKQYGTWPKFNF